MGVQEFKGSVGGVTRKGNVIICHGGHECPIHRRSTPQSAQDEADFHRLTGIRIGSYRVRELLEEFRERHKLTWRGRGISRMWKHRTLEYDEARDNLRLNASLSLLIWGWICTIFVFLFLCTMALLMANATKPVAPEDWAKAGAAFLAYSILFYVVVEHMVVPEALARRLRKKEIRDISDATGRTVR